MRDKSEELTKVLAKAVRRHRQRLEASIRKRLILVFLATLPSLPVAAATFDAVNDFSTALNSDTSRWSYRYKPGTVRDGNYPLLPGYGPAAAPFANINPGAWTLWGSVPEVGVNQTGSDAPYTTGVVWPKDTMLVHPGNIDLVIVSWLSPSNTFVNINFSFTDLDPNGGNGIAWFVEKNDSTTTLSSGSFANGGESGPLTLIGIPVSAGDRINFIIDPDGDYGFDSTMVTATIAPNAETPDASCPWRFATATLKAGTSSRLRLYLTSPGEAYIDDLTLVEGTMPETGPNLIRNGDFESEFPGTNYVVTANYSNSSVSTAIKHFGNASLHLVGIAAGTSDSNIIYQDITPALSNGQTYTLSYWYAIASNLMVRVVGSAISTSSSCIPPCFTLQPASQVIFSGSSSVLITSVAGTAPLSYQWYKNNSPLPGATNSSLTFPSTWDTNSGDYVIVAANACRSVTSQVATLTVVDPVIVEQPRSQTVPAGSSITFTVMARGTAPLSYQWRKDGAILADGGVVSGAATASLQLSNVLGGDAGGYSVVITNVSGSVISAFATLTVVDPVINLPPATQTVNAGDSVTLSVTAAGTEPLSYQWRKDRLVQTGTTQSSLTLTNLQGSDAGSYDVVVSNVWGNSTSAVALLTVNQATLDTSFNPGADSVVSSLALQADGKILVAGGFTTLGGQSRTNIGRLNADGTVDTSFNPGADSFVYSLALQADGKILVAGGFGTLGGQSRNRIGRLNADGTLDTSFNPGADNYVASLAVQADGKILVGGGFGTLGGQTRNNIGRLNADGTLDTNFDPGTDGGLNSLALQADGKILVAGGFGTLGG